MHTLTRLGVLVALTLGLLATSADAQDRRFATLSGANEVPPVATSATGSVRAILTGNTLVVTGSFSGLESDFATAIGAHIHDGDPGTNGPVIVPLNPTLDPDLRGGRFLKRNNTFTVSDEVAETIRSGGAYVNIHSVDNPSGEIRGQLIRGGGTANPTLVQIIHNAPDPAASVVDVYANGVRVVDDLPFRGATPFIDAPANEDIEVGIAPGSSTSAADVLYSETFNLPSGSTTQVIAQGVLDPSMFAPNPSGRSTAFDLAVGANAQLTGPNPNRVALRGVHGSPDAPTVDLRVQGRIAVDDIAFGDVTGYLVAPNQVVEVAVTTADGAPVATYAADLTTLGGSAATVLASGFLSPGNNQGGPAFGLLVVLPDGTTALLPVVVPVAPTTASVPTASSLEVAELALGAPFPNPTVGAASVTFALPAEGAASVAVFDALGREVGVAAQGTYEAGRHTVALGALAAGVYVVRLTAEGETRTQRLTVVR